MVRKVIRNISIDLDLDDLLKKEDNASAVINELLRKNYIVSKVVNMPEEDYQKFKAMHQERDKLDKQIQEVTNGL